MKIDVNNIYVGKKYKKSDAGNNDLRIVKK